MNRCHLRAMCLTLPILFLSLMGAAAQQPPTRQMLEAKKNQLKTVESSIAESKRKIAELEVQLKALMELQSQMKNAQLLVEGLEGQASGLREQIPADEEQIAFWESPPRKILAIEDNGTYVLDFGGTRRSLVLHGIEMDSFRIPEVAKVLRKRLVKKTVSFVVLIRSAARHTFTTTRRA